MEDASGLSLGLGIGGCVPKKEKQRVKKPMPCLDLTFEISPKQNLAIDELDHEQEQGFGLKREIEENPNDQKSSEDNNNGSRKKLRLTKEQSTVLEKTFKQHSTLNPAQKQALAEQLNLKPRQVEVWFQNRRARTKLKQTEVDCEFLKKCCEKLTEDNLRLKKELQELRAFKIGPTPLYIHLSKNTTLTICSSCEELVKKQNNNEGKKIEE